MPYPLELLPKPSFKIIDNLGNFRDTHKLYIVRRLDWIDPNKEFVKEDLELYDLIDKPYKLNNLSCNLLGIEFNENQLSYKVRCSEWSEGSTVDMTEIEGSQPISTPFIPVFWAVSILHDAETPLSTPQNDKKGHKVAAKLSLEIPPPSFGKAQILHKPTKCNFWHFQLHFLDSAEKIISKNKDAKYFEEDLMAFFKNIMQLNVKRFNEMGNDYSILEVEHYTIVDI